MNATTEKPIVVIEDTPQVDPNQMTDLDRLCNFYVHMEVEQLRKMGYQVRVTHYRYEPQQADQMRVRGLHVDKDAMTPMHELRASFELDQDNGEKDTNYMDSHGGRTVIEIRLPDGHEVNDESICSIKDPFNKRKGVRICLGRIFNKLCAYYDVPKRAVKKAVEEFSYLSAI